MSGTNHPPTRMTFSIDTVKIEEVMRVRKYSWAADQGTDSISKTPEILIVKHCV